MSHELDPKTSSYEKAVFPSLLSIMVGNICAHAVTASVNVINHFIRISPP